VNDEVSTPPDAPAASPGAELRAAREAAGLSLDDVAQQLKLAPRQVQALEEDDYAKLPGRTFVRGFVRNYARYLHLDPEALVAMLPDASESSRALDRPTLGPGPRRMGELPAESARKPSPARWLIPLVLVAIVGVAAFYELSRPSSDARRFLSREPAAPSKTQEETPQAPSTPASAPATTTSSLPNPVDVQSSSAPRVLQDSAPAPAATTQPESVPGATAPGPNAVAQPGGATADAASAAVLTVDFRGASWIEVRDHSGNVLLVTTGAPGTRQSVSGIPPLEIVVGKVDAVSVTFKGQPVDLAAQQRGNVARLTLK